LTASEKDLLDGYHGDELEVRLLHIWCAKEAAAKYWRCGLQGRPELFEVIPESDGLMLDSVRVHFDGEQVPVSVCFQGGYIWAVASGLLSDRIMGEVA
jgi:phosphopantetheinyl transferase